MAHTQSTGSTGSTGQVAAYIKRQRHGAVITNEQVAAKTNVQASSVSKTLNRLSAKNQVVRIKRGMWVRPTKTRFGNISASTEEIVRALENERQMIAVPTGAAAANAIGASTQVAMRASYVSTRRVESITIGKRTIEFRYSKSLERAVKALSGLNNQEKHQAATLRVALQYLGPKGVEQSQSAVENAINELPERARVKLRSTLNGPLSWAQRYMKV